MNPKAIFEHLFKLLFFFEVLIGNSPKKIFTTITLNCETEGDNIYKKKRNINKRKKNENFCNENVHMRNLKNYVIIEARIFFLK